MTELPNMVDALYGRSKRQIEHWPCNSNRASSLGDDCERRLVYDRTHLEEKELHDVHLQRIFEEGNLHELALLRELSDAGIEVIEQQRSLDWKQYQITGHVDGVIVVNGKAIPLEIKSMSSHIWDSVAFRGPGVYVWGEVAEAFTRKPWLRRYRSQLSLYMLMKDIDEAILLCKNKATGAICQIILELDYDYAESLLQRAERINKHVAEGTLPPQIEDRAICCECAYAGYCRPDCKGGDPIRFLEVEKVLELCNTRAEHEEAYRAYSSADKQLKSWAKAQDANRLMVCAQYLIEKKLSSSGRVSVKVTKLEDGTPSASS